VTATTGTHRLAPRWPPHGDTVVSCALGDRSTDPLFAFDSIPAVFGVTDHAYIVFAANAFAPLGLRPLFFLVSGLLERHIYISTGLALIVAFIVVKLVLEFAHHEQHPVPQISTAASLAVILAALAVTVTASLAKARRSGSPSPRRITEIRSPPCARDADAYSRRGEARSSKRIWRVTR
jgi:hypothetical protein